MTGPRYPALYQVNTRVWLTGLTPKLRRHATLDDVPDAELDRIVVDRPELDVDLDGCASLAPPGRAISEYRWTVDGEELDAHTCETQIRLTDGQVSKVRLEVVDDLGNAAAMTQDVQPEDHLVVSIGDSIASGEGNPHLPYAGGQDSETWQLRACHRSGWAGPARAAKTLEDADDHSSVTFVQLSCSGAAIMLPRS